MGVRKRGRSSHKKKSRQEEKHFDISRLRSDLACLCFRAKLGPLPPLPPPLGPQARNSSEPNCGGGGKRGGEKEKKT